MGILFSAMLKSTNYLIGALFSVIFRLRKVKTKAKQAEDAIINYRSYKFSLRKEINSMFGVMFLRQCTKLLKKLVDHDFFIYERRLDFQVFLTQKQRERVMFNYLMWNLSNVKRQMNINFGRYMVNRFEQKQIQMKYQKLFDKQFIIHHRVKELMAQTSNSSSFMIQRVHEYKIFHEKILKSLSKKSLQRKRKIWIKENYLNLEIKGQFMVAIFETKYKLTQQIYQFFKSYYEREENDLKKTEEKKRNHRVYFLQYLNASSMVDQMTRLMKTASSGRLENLSQFSKCNQLKYFKFQERISVLDQYLPPTVHLYLILRDKISLEQFEHQSYYFKSMLKSWFRSIDAVLHIVGYTKVEELKQNTWNELEVNKIIDNDRQCSQKMKQN